MDQACILCDHPTIGHIGTGCHRSSFLRGDCPCDFVEPPTLPPSATPEQHRERAAWWARRVDATDREVARGGHPSERWLRLDRFRRYSETERRRHLEAARTLQVETAAVLIPEHEAGDDLLDLIDIEAIASQSTETLRLLAELLERGGPTTQATVRLRLEAGFDALEPRRRRTLLEHAELREFLEHVGVVSRLDLDASAPPTMEPEHPGAGGVRLVRALEDALRGTLASGTIHEALAREFHDTLGDASWAETEDASGRHPRDEVFLARYRTMRSQLETYWRHWAAAPSPDVQHAVVIQHPTAIERQARLAIGVLTPPEKARFRDRAELFGWVVSGMRPLFVDGRPVPLRDVIDPRYLAPPADA